MIIRACIPSDFVAMLAVVNAAATAYDGAIPADCYHVPYMPAAELRAEIAAGVRFFGWFEAEERGGEELWGLMGIQDVDDVTLIRHAYVLPDRQAAGVGGRLLEPTCLPSRPRRSSSAPGPTPPGGSASTSGTATGSSRRGEGPPAAALRRIPERQVETSVVLRLVVP